MFAVREHMRFRGHTGATKRICKQGTVQRTDALVVDALEEKDGWHTSGDVLLARQEVLQPLQRVALASRYQIVIGPSRRDRRWVH
jgi:hypothetical protein